MAEKSSEDVNLSANLKDGTDQRSQSTGFNATTVAGTDDLSEFVGACFVTFISIFIFRFTTF
jgi:hypothetical protein